MSEITDRLSQDDLRELARIVRGIHARTAARLERERLERETGEAADREPAGHQPGTGGAA